MNYNYMIQIIALYLILADLFFGAILAAVSGKDLLILSLYFLFYIMQLHLLLFFRTALFDALFFLKLILTEKNAFILKNILIVFGLPSQYYRDYFGSCCNCHDTENSVCLCFTDYNLLLFFFLFC